jgi:hypothetical protein
VYSATHCPLSSGPHGLWETEAYIGRRAGVPVRTLQVRDRYDGRPFVVGPGNADWEVQRVLTDLRPVHARATAFERARAVAELRSVRFHSSWSETSDVTGPLRSESIQYPRIPANTPPDRDVSHATCFGMSYGGVVLWFDRRTNQFRHVPLANGSRLPQSAGVGFDPRRRRFLIVEGDSNRPGLYIHRYDLDSELLTNTYSHRTGGFSSVAYSAQDDCFYATAWVVGPRGAMLVTVMRISPDGEPQWQIPVSEYVSTMTFRVRVFSAGRHLVLLTPLLPDPLDPAAPRKPRCVVIEPGENRVVYSGAMEVREGREDRR